MPDYEHVKGRVTESVQLISEGTREFEMTTHQSAGRIIVMIKSCRSL